MNGGSAGAVHRIAVVAVVLWATTLAVFWPGYALYDSVAQYRQATSGTFDDWHPPIMAALWRILHRSFGGGAGPMLVAQLGGWWLGLGLIAAALARQARARAATAILMVGLMPSLLGWQVAVLKDAQLAGAMIAATGLVAWWRLRDRALPWPARAGVVLLLVYATLVRANAVFAVAPLVAGLAMGSSLRRRILIVIVVTVGGLAAMGPVNHDLLGAERSRVERTQAIYDLARIAVRLGAGEVPGMSAAERVAIETKGCASPFFWDPLGDEMRCGGDLTAIRDATPAALYRDLGWAVVAHPVAYVTHRVAHLNSTERWLVPFRWPGAAPPVGGEANPLGLTDPGGVAKAWQTMAGWVVETPLGWPVCWVIVALAALVSSSRLPAGPRSLVVALAASALTLEASFAVVSIASDLRYHLWSMTASALAALMVLAEARPPQRVWHASAAVLALVITAGVVARAVLPVPPQTYAGMLFFAG